MPPISTPLLAVALVVPFPLFAVYEYRRLAAEYPTRRVAPNLEISSRTDTPILEQPARASKWLHPSSGDQWTAIVPRSWLVTKRQNGAAVGAGDLVQRFAEVFWTTWPLRLERFLLSSLAAAGIGPFAFRQPVYLQETQGKSGQQLQAMAPGQGLVGGLFMVEAHDEGVSTSPAVPAAPNEGTIITSWWLKNSNTKIESRKPVKLRGGYHTLAVERCVPGPGSQEVEELVRLTFASFLVLTPPTPHPAILGEESQSTFATTKGMTWVQKLTMTFHVAYSRILLDLAVRRLKSQAGR